jgi:hypothetical protein
MSRSYTSCPPSHLHVAEGQFYFILQSNYLEQSRLPALGMSMCVKCKRFTTLHVPLTLWHLVTHTHRQTSRLNRKLPFSAPVISYRHWLFYSSHYSETCLCWPPMVPPKTAQLIENNIFHMTIYIYIYIYSYNNYPNRIIIFHTPTDQMWFTMFYVLFVNLIFKFVVINVLL